MALARNRRAKFNFHIEKTFEAGLVLQGWEVKSIRAGLVQITDAYVLIRNGEAVLVGCFIKPLTSASTHVDTVADRPRKLLLHIREIKEIHQAVQTRGKSCIAISMYWKALRVKCEIAIASGKKQYDKRQVIKDREWRREKERVRKYHKQANHI